MKKLEIIIKSEKLDTIKRILDDQGASGAMITNIMGYGNQKGYKTTYRGSDYMINLLPKIKVETVVEESKVEDLITAIETELNTDSVGAGKIFIYNVEDAVRIRTKERGDAAL